MVIQVNPHGNGVAANGIKFLEIIHLHIGFNGFKGFIIEDIHAGVAHIFRGFILLAGTLYKPRIYIYTQDFHRSVKTFLQIFMHELSEYAAIAAHIQDEIGFILLGFSILQRR